MGSLAFFRVKRLRPTNICCGLLIVLPPIHKTGPAARSNCIRGKENHSFSQNRCRQYAQNAHNAELRDSRQDWTKSKAQADVVSNTFGPGPILPPGLSPHNVPSRGLQAIVDGLGPELKIGPGPNMKGTTSIHMVD